MNQTKQQLLTLIHSDEREAAYRYNDIVKQACETTHTLIDSFRDQLD